MACPPGLKKELDRIDGRSYPAYRDIKGAHDFGDFLLVLDRIQGDPFASPSRIHVSVPDEVSGFPDTLFDTPGKRTAFEDFIARTFENSLAKHSGGRRGSGKSGLIYIDPPGQEIVRRTSVVKTEDAIEVRFFVGLPARGRRIDSGAAADILCGTIPRVVADSLLYSNTDAVSVLSHIRYIEDAGYIRSKLAAEGLIAFIADGSNLPRMSGIDDRPMPLSSAVGFSSPESLKVAFDTPNSGEVPGMGIARGVTLIAGGGYHGKSTLLRAIETGIYDHIPGDGREFALTDAGAVKIRSEDGRRIESVDITPFINNLPFGRDTSKFSTENASGSTSQAANIVEAAEAGAKVLLIDEDTSATNFMIRDARMQELISKENEPITPFIDRVRGLYEDHGISSIIVAGGCGDYIDVADTVICMKEYGAFDVTVRAKEIASYDRSRRAFEGAGGISCGSPRVPDRGSVSARRGKNPVKISVKEEGKIEFGTERIDMSAVENIYGKSQLRAIGLALNYAVRYMDGRRSIPEIARLVGNDMERSGPGRVSGEIRGDLSEFRPIEFCAALNRLRTMRVL